MNLPDVNGFEVCRKLKADPKTARIPVVHVSASFAVADLWQATFEAIRDAVLLVGPDERVSRVNLAAAALVARDRGDREARRSRPTWTASSGRGGSRRSRASRLSSGSCRAASRSSRRPVGIRS